MNSGGKCLKATWLWIVLCGLAVLSTAAWSQQAKRTVIHAGKLLDVRSGNTLVDQAIVIEGGKIVSVGPMTATKVSGNEQRFELGSATLLPGLIDAHTHLTGNPQFGYD